MSLEPRTPIDRAAHRLLHDRTERVPETLWSNVERELDASTKQRTWSAWWLSLFVLGALAFALSTDWSATEATIAGEGTDEQEAELIAAATSHDVRGSTDLEEGNAATTPATLVETKSAGRQSAEVQPTVENVPSLSLSQNSSHADTRSLLTRAEAVPLATLTGSATLLTTTSAAQQTTTQQARAAASTSDVAPRVVPEEFAGYTPQATVSSITIATSDLPDLETARSTPQAGASIPSGTASHQTLLPLPTQQLAPLSQQGFDKLSCPGFTPVSGDRELRVSLLAGPRFDRKVFADAPNTLSAYRSQRIELEEMLPGAELQVRAEVGRQSGMFAGVGLGLGTYRSRYAILGEPTTTTRIEERVRDGVVVGVDTVRFVTRDTTWTSNRTRTISAGLTGGYRYTLGRVALYVAADASFDLVAEAAGTHAGLDADHQVYATGQDNWIARRPGFSMGGRVGADIDISRSLGGDPGRLAVLLEASARNTGVFSGDDDPLSFRYSRIGGSAGLRYRF